MTRHARALATAATAAATLSLIGIAPSLRAQVPPPPTPALAGADTLFDAHTNAALQRLLQAALAAGLPDAPLHNRMRQGAARGVAGDRVLALVRAHLDSMRAAREALGIGTTADELDAGAAALHAGATRAVLRRLRTTRGEGTATTALVVLTDLVWRGVAPGDAADAVATIARRAPDRALLALQGAVAREGAPANARMLHAMVERVAPGGREPHPQPRRPPGTTDSLQQREPSGSLTLSSLSAPASATPDALLAQGDVVVPMGERWTATPWAALRTGDATRWGAALALARHFRPTSSTVSRLWLSGELRSGVAESRRDLPLHQGREVRVSHERRPPDLATAGGVEMQRPVGAWSVGGALSLGVTRFSRLETQLVSRTVPAVRDSLTPRPDTLAPRTELVAEQRWLARTGSAVRGVLTAQRGNLRVEGAISRQVGAWRGASDSTATRQRTVLSLAAEHRVAPWASLVGQWASRDPSAVHGTLTLTDARWQLGLRLAEHRPRELPRRPTATATSGDAGAVYVDVALESLAPSPRGDSQAIARVRVRLAGGRRDARLVEIEGDLTGWQPVALPLEARGTFAASFPVSSAVVRLRLRVDGGPWFIPAGAATQRDDFGDEVAVVVLPLDR